MNVRTALTVTALALGTGVVTAPAAHAGDFECRGALGGSIQANKNTGGLTITGNRIVNGLQCQDNFPAPTGGGNIAAQKQGQCVAL